MSLERVLNLIKDLFFENHISMKCY